MRNINQIENYYFLNTQVSRAITNNGSSLDLKEKIGLRNVHA